MSYELKANGQNIGCMPISPWKFDNISDAITRMKAICYDQETLIRRIRPYMKIGNLRVKSPDDYDDVAIMIYHLNHNNEKVIINTFWIVSPNEIENNQIQTAINEFNLNKL